MNNKADINIEGRITIFSFRLSYEGDIWQIYIKALYEGKTYDCVFINVSSLKMNMYEYDLVIEGFHIIDNLLRGWEKDKRYLVSDYESDTISFYCEDIEVSEQDNNM